MMSKAMNRSFANVLFGAFGSVVETPKLGADGGPAPKEGSVEDVVRRLEPRDVRPRESRPPGRPKLGVVGREVTLLPRHWEWLATQPGGASVTLRRLVEEARRAGGDEERKRQARDAAYRFMFAVAGNEPGFEEASRALFAGDQSRFEEETERWPADVREHARTLARDAIAG
jgi:hypothetical protein